MKTLVLKLESATPTVDRPVSGVDGRKVEQDGVCSLPHLDSVHSCHASSFIKLYKNKQLIQEKVNVHDEIQYIQ